MSFLSVWEWTSYDITFHVLVLFGNVNIAMVTVTLLIIAFDIYIICFYGDADLVIITTAIIAMVIYIYVCVYVSIAILLLWSLPLQLFVWILLP